jgi:hypothetical protein
VDVIRRTPQTYRHRAEECEREAEQTTNAVTREIFFYLAARWRKLADEDERREARIGTPSASAEL